MELHTYLTQVRDHLTSAAALGDERTQQVAAALTTAVAPALQLAVLAAVSEAADEITAALLDQPGSPAVGVRLDGDEVRIEVRTSADTTAARPPVDEGDASARISLRLSETLKSEIDAAARAAAVSVNTWLVRAAAGALAPSASPGGNTARHQHRVTGWING